MTTTYTVFTAGHNTHASVEQGITVCGKRTEDLAPATGRATCRYCSDRTADTRNIDALVRAVRSV